MSFDPNAIDWNTWEAMVRQYCSDFTHDQYKKSLLWSKLPLTIQQTLTNYQSFEDCMASLKTQFGDPVRAMKERITTYVKFCQELPTRIENVEQVAKDVARIQGLTIRLANARDTNCKCAATEKRACIEVGHEPNDHCIKHCNYDAYRKDSDSLHSVLTTLAANRLPQEMLVQVGTRVRDEEKAQDRTVDIQKYVELLMEYINVLKSSRVSIKTAHPPTGKPGYGKLNHHNEIGLAANENETRAPKPKFCLCCQRSDHWISNCAMAKNMTPNEIIAKIKASKGCTICIIRGHTAKECRRRDKQKCYYCADNNIPGANTHKKLVCPKRHGATTQEAAMIGNEQDINHFED